MRAAPALVTVTAGAAEPRYPSLRGRLRRSRSAAHAFRTGLVPPRRSCGPRSDSDRDRAPKQAARSSGCGRSSGQDRARPPGGEGLLAVAGAWVYAELGARGDVDGSALELLTKARALAVDVTAVALGPGAFAAARILGEHGATRVLASDDAVFEDYPAEPAAHVLAELVREHAPQLVLFGPSYGSRDVAGRLQALLGSTLVANVDDVVALDHVRLTVALGLWPGRPGNLRGGIGGAKVVDVRLADHSTARQRAGAGPSTRSRRADGPRSSRSTSRFRSRKRARRLERIEEGGAGARWRRRGWSSVEDEASGAGELCAARALAAASSTPPSERQGGRRRRLGAVQHAARSNRQNR